MKQVKFFLLSSSLIIAILFSSCVKKPGACFSASKSDPKEGESVTFTSCSTEANSFEWDFGDNATSTETSPAHTYNKEGTYTVKLKVYSKNKKKTSEASETITVLSKWTTLISGTSANLNSISFSDVNTGYIVGDGGTMLKTMSAGYAWSNPPSNTTQNLNGINFISSNIGIFAGANATIGRTTDGSTWSTSAGFNGTLYDVNFGTSGIYGCLVGQNGLIYFTINSGATYTSFPAIVSSNLRGIHFSGISTAYAVGSGGTILKSTNGGMAWSVLNSGTVNDLNDVYFIDANTGYAVGNSIILKTTNAGNSWSQYTAYSGKINSVLFVDVNTGYVACESGAILKTSDAGVTWTTHKEPNNIPLNDIYFTLVTTGYAVGNNGTIFKYLGN